MHIGSAIVLVALIWLAIVYPGFRRVVSYVLVAVVFFGFIAIVNLSNQSAEIRRQSEAQQRQLEERRRVAAAAIKTSDLALESVTLVPADDWSQYHDYWVLKGTVTNNSRYALSGMTFDVGINDCPSPHHVTDYSQPPHPCRVVGNTTADASPYVPAGQTRAFQSAEVQFYGLPAKEAMFERSVWWTLTKINSDGIYRQTTYAATAPAPAPPAPTIQAIAPAPKPTANSELINSILYGPSNNSPVRNTFVAGDEHHCPSDYAWDWQNKSCRLGTSFRAYGSDGGSK